MLKNRIDSFRFGFNGKEKIDEVTNVSGANYDFDERMYDARLGRFTSIDPLAAKFPAITPYCFVNNMPIIAKDEDGKELKFMNNDSKYEFFAAVGTQHGGAISAALRNLALGGSENDFNKIVKAVLKTATSKQVREAMQKDIDGLSQAVLSKNRIWVEVISPTSPDVEPDPVRVNKNKTRVVSPKMLPEEGSTYTTLPNNNGKPDEFKMVGLDYGVPTQVQTSASTDTDNENNAALVLTTSPTIKLDNNAQKSLLNGVIKSNKVLDQKKEAQEVEDQKNIPQR